MKIGIVNARPSVAEVLRKAVLRVPGHHVIWSAATGWEAVERAARESPDLVLMDLRVAGMDCIEATRQLTACCSCAVMLTTDSLQANAGRIVEALGHGAFDAFELPPDLGLEGTAALIEKIDIVSRLIGRSTTGEPPVSAFDVAGTAADSLLAIGASAGGPEAVAAVLGGLPADCGAAVVIVQHVDAQFALGMAAWLGDQARLPVRVAAHGDCPAAGTVLIAGRNDHLVLTSPERLGYTRDPHQAIYRPSIDVFFESVVRHWRRHAVGVLLTGMGRDGAAGLKAMRTAGFHTIAQDEATSAVYGMPKAAAAIDAAAEILPIDRIAERLQEPAVAPGRRPEERALSRS